MKFDIKNRKNILILSAIFVVLAISIVIYKKVGSADSYANRLTMKNVSLTSIETGSGPFKGSEIDSSKINITASDYTAGDDASSSNRIVRSFDKLVYHFNFSIKGKNDSNDYEGRNVNVEVKLSDTEAKYIAFDVNGKAGETSHTFTFDGIDTYGDFNKEVTLYVLGAPNFTEIKPKFVIKESTDSSEGVTLGNISDETYYYDYDSEASNNYTTTSNSSGFTNYMPTYVSSKQGNLRVSLKPQVEEGQKTTYNDQVGRYLTYVFGLEIVGDATYGIKGLTMPDGSDISFNVDLSQNGADNTVLTVADGWGRLYNNQAVGEVEPVVVGLPYSTSTGDNSRETKFPGDFSFTKSSDTSYTAKISNYNVTYKPARKAADSTEIGINDHYIGSYAVTVFSPRVDADGKNDITATMKINSSSVNDTAGTALNIAEASTTITNKYYEVIDYSLKGEFYDGSGTSKLSTDGNGKGSTSKGTNLIYKTTFNYKKTMSSQGLKEVIKVDPNALRVVPLSDDQDIKITVVSEEGKITAKDFEVKYISGSFANSNYTKVESAGADGRYNSEDKEAIMSKCGALDLSTLSVDQIQNLYGGPCIAANADVEKEYDKIVNAKTEGEDSVEDPITKIIVQTKDGVKLPDSVKVTVDVGIRVRNVSDLTQTYQATAVATSSDYDTNLSYYSPMITPSNEENSILSPNNYIKTTYNGTSVAGIDTDSPWGDSLKIVNFTSRQTITVTNKNTDGSVKTNYNVADNETLYYNVKTIINDNNEAVGADDVWYINYLKVQVVLPAQLKFVPDKSLGIPEVIGGGNGETTTLIYTLPYTKPNQKIKDINFKAVLRPNITGTGVEITTTSSVEAININGERDTSYFGYLSDSFTIYATGIQNVILSQSIGKEGSVVEKNAEFSYVFSGYNNAGSAVTDYNIVDILPSSNDKNGSKFSGKYKVKVTLPSSLSKAKVTCSTQEYSKLSNEVYNKNNVFSECNILDEYVDATAIRISDIEIPKDSYMDDIIVSIKPEGNKYSDKYINSFIGGNTTFSPMKSNKIEARVISRNISGRIFVDMDEDGIEEDGDQYLNNIPVTLYKLDSDNKATKVSDVVTDKNGQYKFKDLEVGRYKVSSNYDASKYDLTLRYATEDYEHDSDAYKIADGKVEIAYTRTINDTDSLKNSLTDLRVTRDVESVEDLNIGLINRKNFGFDMSKYITKIDLSYNNTLNTLNYDNLSKVSISVKNSLKATAKVYYGVTLTNNSSKAGYAKLIQEDIPAGLVFDPNDPYNSQWFEANGAIQSIAFEKDLIKPGESRYLKIALFMPTQEQAATFVNTVTMLEIEPYESPVLAADKNADSNTYEVGEALSYAGVNWHVISVAAGDNDDQILTLLADSGTISNHYSHSSNYYKWGESSIKGFINGSWLDSNTINAPILVDQVVCNDASGTPNLSSGGALSSQITSGKPCVTNDFVTTKVRLLTEDEFNAITGSGLTDMSWIYGTVPYWLQNGDWIEQTHDSYGRIKDDTNYKNKAKYVTGNMIVTGNANTQHEVRPVITVSNKNIIPE